MDQKDSDYNIIHLDVNETICKFDSTIADDNLSIKDKQKITALITIAKYLKGNEVNNKFVPDEDGKITYKEYLIAKYDKKSRRKITQNILEDFHGNKQVKIMYESIMSKLGNNILLPSAIKLFNKLIKENKKFIVLFRTFGTDFHLVEKELGHLYPDVKVQHESPSKCKDYYDIIESIISSNKSAFVYIKDNYDLWHKNGWKKEYGKLFPLIKNSWFFDDNDDIINPRTKDNEYISYDQLPPGCHIDYVHTYDNVIDENYFINKIHLK